MLDIQSMPWEELRESIRPEIFTTRIDPEDKWPEVTHYPDDTFFWPLGSLQIVFIIEICFSDSTYQREAISHSTLRRWGINEDVLRQSTIEEYSRFPAAQWNRVPCMGTVYEPPDFTSFWVNDLLNPTFLQPLKLKGRALLMVPWTDYFIVTGECDLCGRRSQKSIARNASPDGTPLTPRPLVWDGYAWKEI